MYLASNQQPCVQGWTSGQERRRWPAESAGAAPTTCAIAPASPYALPLLMDRWLLLHPLLHSYPGLAPRHSNSTASNYYSRPTSCSPCSAKCHIHVFHKDSKLTTPCTCTRFQNPLRKVVYFVAYPAHILLHRFKRFAVAQRAAMLSQHLHMSRAACCIS
jgi:hypothetical protein